MKKHAVSAGVLMGLMVLIFTGLRQGPEPAAMVSAPSSGGETPPPPVRGPRPSKPEPRKVAIPRSGGTAAALPTGWRAETKPEQAAFAEWTDRFLAHPQAEGIAAEGARLAAARRPVMLDLIRTDPRRALAAAVPVMVRKALPQEVVDLLEERVSGTGELAWNGAVAAPGKKVREAVFQTALIGGTEYRAHTFGLRQRQGAVTSASLIGISLEREMAVSDSPVRVLESGETADGRTVEEVCPVSGTRTPGPAPSEAMNLGEIRAVESHGAIQLLCQHQHVAAFEENLRNKEIVAGNTEQGSSGVAGRPTAEWTQGPKTVLIIRVDFPDLPGVPVNPSDRQPISDSYVLNRFAGPDGVSEFFRQCSYGKTTLSLAPAGAGGISPDVTPVLRMPRQASSYAVSGNNPLLHSDARAAAAAAGVDVESYDRIGVVFSDLSEIPGSLIDYGGLGYIIGRYFWINGYFNFNIVAHEIGHNYGLNHSNLWQVQDADPVSPGGVSVEYGDIFDVMGDGDEFAHQFSPWNRSILHWIPDAAVATAVSAGTWRIHRFDHAAASLTGTLALKIPRNRTEDYWIGYRRSTDNAALDNGAYVVWGYNQNVQGNLLDMTTPGFNPGGVHDEALLVGTTFEDRAAGITIKPVLQGGAGGADEWLDVQVGVKPRVSWSLPVYAVDEQAGTVTLMLSRSGDSSGSVSVGYATVNGTAVAPADYTTASGTVNWADGDMADKPVTIIIRADSAAEGTQQFNVVLSNPAGGIILDDPAAVVTIADAGAADADFVPDFLNNTVNKVLVAPDGTVILGGWFSSVQDSVFTDFERGGLTALTPEGRLLPDFCSEGGAAGGGGGDDDPAVFDLARQPDGKILVAGQFTSMNGVGRSGIARLNADGSVDPTFNHGAGTNDTVYAVALQPDGKVVIGGSFTAVNGVAREYLARLNADGSLDTTFTGPNFADTTGWWVQSLALQPDGKILVGGDFYFSGTFYKASLCRVTATGSLDSAFSGIFAGADRDDYLPAVMSILVQGDGKIVIAGDFTSFNDRARGGVARLAVNGAVETAFAPTSDGECHALLQQPDGKILVGGTFSVFNNTTASRLTRLLTSGAADTSFWASGGPQEKVETMAVQADGKVVFGGDYGEFQENGEGPLWRFYTGMNGNALPGMIGFKATAATAAEGLSAVLSVARTGGSKGAVTVNYSTVPGTAEQGDFTAASGTLSWADGDMAVKTVTVPILADELSEGAESFTVNLGGAVTGGAILGAIQQTVVRIATPYGAWVADQFSAADQKDAALSGPLADPDHDGVVNLMEFALKLNPGLADSGGLPAAEVRKVDGTDYLTLTFKRLLSASGITYTVLTASDPAGSWAADAVQAGVPAANSDGTETVTFRDAVPVSAQAGAGRRFMRVQVSGTP